MRAVVQRVSRSSVTVDRQIAGKIEKGILVLLGVENGDTEKDFYYTLNKVVGLRIFEDDNQKMNLSLQDVGGSMLVVSQFTLLGDVRKGKRPSFVSAAAPDIAKSYFDQFVQKAKMLGINVETGIFQANMSVELVNEGPVTILVDSRKTF